MSPNPCSRLAGLQATGAGDADASEAGARGSMRIDPVLKDTCLSDPVGASAVFYDTRVKLIKVA